MLTSTNPLTSKIDSLRRFGRQCKAFAEHCPDIEPNVVAFPSRIGVTLFPSGAAQSMQFKSMTLEELRDLIASTSRKTKEKLPWLKLARFSGARSEKNCLRFNEAVTDISGIELDYDGGEMTLEAAVAVAEKARLQALLYTSASYTNKKPKWRLLLPTSKPLPPGEREKLVARVNGLYGGIFDHASFVLSQSYYFGSVNNNPKHRAVVTKGICIDLRGDLDAGAIGKNGRDNRYDASGHIKNQKPVEREDIVKALDAIPSDDYKIWFEVGCTLYHELGDDGFELFNEWSKKSDKYDAGTVEAKWDECKKISGFTVGTIFHYADQADPDWRQTHLVGVRLEDFYAYMPMHSYIFAPSREMWPAASVNSRIPPVAAGGDAKIKASTWIDQNQAVEMITWAPGFPMIVADRLVDEGGWIERKGVSTYNLYRPPTIEPGDASKAKRWVALVHKVFPSDADHLIMWFAQRVQQPGIKINHALVLGSLEQGVGKDTIVEGVKRAVGSGNFKELAPKKIFDPFNPWLRAVILRVNEAKDMGDVSRFELYDGMKTLLAAPPDTLQCNEKHIKQHYVFNVMGVVVTTNHLTDGIYLPAEDRRHYVAWSDCKPADFAPGFWTEFWDWYDAGGDRHVAAYLATLDISKFDPKAPPKKTAAFWSIVNANRTTEEAELQDILDRLDNPDAVTIAEISAAAAEMFSFREFLRDRKNRKAVSHRLESCGYRAVNNQAAKDGLWRINERRQMVYAKVALPLGAQLKAAGALVRRAARAAEKAAKEGR